MYQAEFDAAAYAALLRDLSALDGTLEVSVKSAAETFVAEGAHWTLARAREALEVGEVRAIQIRYVHEASVGIDTILRGPAGFRLVRMHAHTRPSP